jgi:hypothetical protein
MGIQAIGSTSAVDLTTLAQSQPANASATASAASGSASQPAPAKAGGARPAGGGGGVKPAASGGSSGGSSSSSKVYDKRDTNKDGTVSYQEAMLYALAHPDDDEKSTASVPTSQLQSGINAYQQSSQKNGTSLISLFSAA